MTEQTSEKEIGVRWIGVLTLAFILVYTLFFGMQQKWQKALQIDQSASTNTHNAPVADILEDNEEDISPMLQVQEAQQIQPETASIPSSGPTSAQEDKLAQKGIFSVQSLFEEEAPKEEGMMLLADTRHREGTMQSAELLGLTPSIRYILKNMDNTHFVYLGNIPPNITDRVEQQWWNLVALSTKNDIDASWLFWDTIIQISLPDYQSVKHKQLFLVEFKQTGDRWFLQVDDDAYERSKPLFKELFAKRYDW